MAKAMSKSKIVAALAEKTAITKKCSASYLEALADRKSTRLNSSHIQKSRMPSSA